MEWISVKQKPDDDQTILAINKKIIMLPVKCYFSQEWDEFISLETSGTIHPISITHWMPLPELPK